MEGGTEGGRECVDVNVDDDGARGIFLCEILCLVSLLGLKLYKTMLLDLLTLSTILVGQTLSHRWRADLFTPEPCCLVSQIRHRLQSSWSCVQFSVSEDTVAKTSVH